MSDDRMLERAARSWIQAGPDQAPERVVAAALRQIETTHQERDLRVPWRLPIMLSPARVAVAAAVGALVIGASLLFRGPAATVGDRPSPSPSPSAAPTATPHPTPRDYSALPGFILAEHLGNAFDGSDPPTEDFNPDRRRFYLLDPAEPTYDAAVEFLPGQPSTGKFAADVSADGTKVVFQDWTERPRLYEAGLDGTDFRQLPIDCECQLLYPDYDPSGTRIVYTRIEAGETWLEVLDLGTGGVTPLQATRRPADNQVPDQPAWSPDGSSIAFTTLTWPEGAEPVVGTVRYGDQPPESGTLEVLNLDTGELRELPLPAGMRPEDANWSPDSRTILFTDGPGSTSGSVAGMPAGRVHRINVDGTGLDTLLGWGGPKYTPDGEHILVQDNVFYLMRPDGTDRRPLNTRASDLSTQPGGYIYIGHWIDAP